MPKISVKILFISFLFLYASCINQGVSSSDQEGWQRFRVKTGIEVLRERGFDLLRDKKVGLVTNPTGVDNALRATIDILHSTELVDLRAVYSPEHGVRGDHAAGEYVQNYVDSLTGLPVYSLYGKFRKPSAQMLSGIEVLVYDIQDIGCRSYTYISTMGLVMEAAAELGIEVVILDRPNPIGGEHVEGCLVEKNFTSFVSQYPIPYVYGLTCGELAQMINREGWLNTPKKCKLKVVPMQGWQRSMTFEDTGLPWVPASPHIPHKKSPYFYPISGILGELSVFSIGVGYTLPFQTFAADWIDDPSLFAEKLNEKQLPGLRFRPISYKPYYAIGKGSRLNGVQVHIVNAKQALLSEVQFRVMEVNHTLYPNKNPFALAPKNRLKMFDKVCGTDRVRKVFQKNFKFEDIQALWYDEAKKFRTKSAKYYLY